MSLDPPKSEADIIKLWKERTGSALPEVPSDDDLRARTRIVLGPASPLLPDGRQSPRVAKKVRAASKGLGASKTAEHDMQVELFVWAEAQLAKYPELALLHAIPNVGTFSVKLGARMKAEGRKPGVPDVHLPVARGGYHSLYIELKKPGGVTSPAQSDWLYALAKQGNRAVLHSTFEAARDELLAYLDGLAL